MEKLFQHKSFPWIVAGSIIALLIFSSRNNSAIEVIKKQGAESLRQLHKSAVELRRRVENIEDSTEPKKECKSQDATEEQEQ